MLPPPTGRAPERASPGWGPGSLPQHTCRTPASRLRCPWLPPKRHAVLHPCLQPSPGPTTGLHGAEGAQSRGPPCPSSRGRVSVRPTCPEHPTLGSGICLASLKRPTGYLSYLCLQYALGHMHFSATSGSPPGPPPVLGGVTRRHSHSLPSTGESLRRVFVRHCL